MEGWNLWREIDSFCPVRTAQYVDTKRQRKFAGIKYNQEP